MDPGRQVSLEQPHYEKLCSAAVELDAKWLTRLSWNSSHPWCEHLEELILCMIICTSFRALEVSLSMLCSLEMLLYRFLFQHWCALDLCANVCLLFGRTGFFWLAFLPSCGAGLVLANLIHYAAQGEVN